MRAFWFVPLLVVTLMSCEGVSDSLKEKGRQIGQSAQDGAVKLMERAEKELPKHGQRIIRKGESAVEAAELGAEFLAENLEELQKSKSKSNSLLQGVLRSGNNGAPIPEGHVFSLRPDTGLVTRLTRTSGRSSNRTGEWILRGLPSLGVVVLVGIEESLPGNLAVLEVPLSGGFDTVEGLITRSGSRGWNTLERETLLKFWKRYSPDAEFDPEALGRSLSLLASKRSNN